MFLNTGDPDLPPPTKLAQEHYDPQFKTSLAEGTDNIDLFLKSTADNFDEQELACLSVAWTTRDGNVERTVKCSDGGATEQDISPLIKQYMYPLALENKRLEDSKRRLQDTRTTVLLRNLPSNYTRATVADMLNVHGFWGDYDFLYLPMDFSTGACLGYAFINLVDYADAPRFWQTFDGFSSWVIPNKNICFVTWSYPQQGLQANIDRYKNSAVMHESVPEEFKPLLLENGEAVPFPSPTHRIRRPRMVPRGAHVSVPQCVFGTAR